MALAHPRCGHTFAPLTAGFGVGLATAHRYVTEAVDVLAVLALTLQQTMAVAARKAFVILDGTLLSIDRVAADRLFPTRSHGLLDALSVGGIRCWADKAYQGSGPAVRVTGLVKAVLTLELTAST